MGARGRFPRGIRPIVPANLAASLTCLIAEDQPYLKKVKADCPSGAGRSFPVSRRFTATDAAPPPGSCKALRQSFPRPNRAAGTMTALGVYSRTGTYEYELANALRTRASRPATRPSGLNRSYEWELNYAPPH